MKRAAVAVALFVGSAIGFAGCDAPRNSGTGGTTPPTTDRKGDIDVHVRTPGADVDVERKGEGKAKVNVRTKDTGR